MKKLFILIILLFLSSCTIKAKGCDMVDSKAGSEEKFIEFLNTLNPNERFELTVKLTEVENSIKTQRIFESEICPESLESINLEINSRKYTLKYLKLNNNQFSLIIEIEGESFIYSRNY